MASLDTASGGLTQNEIVALKALANDRKDRPARNYPFLVSLLAFVLSLVTSIISAYVGHRKDIHDQQVELAAAFRTINELNLLLLEMREKYKPGTTEEGNRSAILTTQLHATVVVATEIALGLGANARAAVLIPISQFVYTQGDYTKAEELANLALSIARIVEEEGTALRWLGSMRMRSGSKNAIAEANQFYYRAANLDQKYDLSRFTYKSDWLKALSLLSWANALAPVDCDQARQRYLEGVVVLNSAVRNNVMLDQQRGNAQRTKVRGIGGVSTCLPTSDTPAVL